MSQTGPEPFGSGPICPCLATRYSQKSNRRVSCMIRGLFTTELILPNATFEPDSVTEGLAKSTLLNRLYASARNVNVFLSLSWKRFTSEESTLKNCGPRKVLRHDVP